MLRSRLGFVAGVDHERVRGVWAGDLECLIELVQRSTEGRW